MKYVITGGAGNISRPLSKKLLDAGHDVTVIGRNAENLKPLTEMGARSAIGSIEDISFLKRIFADADAVYTMVPPNYSAPDLKGYHALVGKNYAVAIRGSKIKHVVNLSSVGAHLPEGCGPVTGLYRVEQALNEVQEVPIKHLRPAYLFSNLLGSVSMVKNMNIIGSNFGGPDFTMLLADTHDVAAIAFEELENLNFTGHTARYICSDEVSTDKIARVLGNAVAKPELPWIVFSNGDAIAGMLQMGLPEEMAKNYAEMCNAIHTGIMFEDYWKNHPGVLGKTKLEDFAKTFALVYNQQ